MSSENRGSDSKQVHLPGSRYHFDMTQSFGNGGKRLIKDSFGVLECDCRFDLRRLLSLLRCLEAGHGLGFRRVGRFDLHGNRAGEEIRCGGKDGGLLLARE